MVNDFETIICNIPVIISKDHQLKGHWVIKSKNGVTFGYIDVSNITFINNTDYKQYIIKEANKLDIEGYNLVNDTTIHQHYNNVVNAVILTSFITLILLMALILIYT